jgi:hypothetical protein
VIGERLRRIAAEPDGDVQLDRVERFRANALLLFGAITTAQGNACGHDGYNLDDFGAKAIKDAVPVVDEFAELRKTGAAKLCVLARRATRWTNVSTISAARPTE